ncbi:MAG TPA: 50S ribosomal protein L17 [Verrucomicrobiales bacterium]|nr:50S ribosomal protein L17 [Verrucomicrobiales bacterium]|tara:strand:- start:56 stop:775 length:720 start_codon:yes stop_codon:yes gene_type:complete
MRHRIRKAKLGRTTEHRTRMLNNLVCSLIKHRRVTTTLAKAKAARVVADKMVTLGKKGQADGAGLQYRRLIAARLQQNPRTFFPKKNGVSGREQRAYWRENEDVVRILFEDIAPVFENRNGGYTRVIKLGRRKGDAAEMAILEWVTDADSAEADEDPVAKDQPKAEAATAPTEETDEEPVAGAEADEKTAEATAESTEEANAEEEETDEAEAAEDETDAADEKAVEEEPKAEEEDKKSE